MVKSVILLRHELSMAIKQVGPFKKLLLHPLIICMSCSLHKYVNSI